MMANIHSKLALGILILGLTVASGTANAENKRESDGVKAPSVPTLVNVFAGTYSGITPGKTTSVELVASFGKPEQRLDGGKSLVFKVDSVEEIRTSMKAGVVDELAVTLQGPRSTEWAKKILAVKGLVHVDVNLSDQSLRLIPERGISLVRVSAKSEDVTHILIRAPSAKDLIARSRDQRKNGFSQSWSDLMAAVALADDKDPVRLELSELALDLERYDVTKSLLERVDPAKRNAHWKLLIARWIVAIGDRQQAQEAVKSAMNDADATPTIRMVALVELARLESDSKQGNTDQAAQWLQQACDEAMKVLAKDPGNSTATKTLFNAHLEMLKVVSRGKWTHQKATMERWQTNAEKLVPLVMLTGGNIGARQDLLAAIIASRTLLVEPMESADLVKRLEDETMSLVRKGDPILAQQARRNAATALKQIAMRQLRDGANEKAIKTFEGALAALTNQSQPAQLEAANMRRLADVLFARGVVESVGLGDHKAASVWFRRMLSVFDDPRARPFPRHAILRGDQLVSVGVSFWKIGAKKDAMEVTVRGLRYIESAIDVGWADPDDRTVAVQNLKAMYEAEGDKEKAKLYSAQLQRDLKR
jgi:tetratricopeptide (TPR) repeat protein